VVQYVFAALAAALLFTVIVVVYKLVRQRPYVGATRVGIFIERDYDEEPDEERANEDTKVLWPKEDDR
jgi:hypothetical protein